MNYVVDDKIVEKLGDIKTRTASFLNGVVGAADCQAYMGGVRRDKRSTVGVLVPKGNICGSVYSKYKNQKIINQFLNWLYDPEESFYGEFIKWLGDDFHVVTDSKGNIHGCYITNFYKRDISVKHTTNFFKAHRTITEHKYVLDSWIKWVDKYNVKNKSLAFFLSYMYDPKNNKMYPSHSCADGVSDIDLEFFLKRDKGLDFTSKDGSYTGEAKAFHKGGSFNFQEIPQKDYTPIESVFYQLYNKKIPTIPSDEDILTFFKNVEQGKIGLYK